MKIRVDVLQKELGLQNKAQLARWFDIEPQAVYQWGAHLPPLRAYRLVEAHPEFEHLAERDAAA